MDLIDTLRGEGIGVSKVGSTPVEYELRIFQNRIRIGHHETIPGIKGIEGWIQPVFGEFGEMLTLELKDRSTVNFFFADRHGKISVRSGPVMFASNLPAEHDPTPTPVL